MSSLLIDVNLPQSITVGKTQSNAAISEPNDNLPATCAYTPHNGLANYLSKHKNEKLVRNRLILSLAGGRVEGWELISAITVSSHWQDLRSRLGAKP